MRRPFVATILASAMLLTAFVGSAAAGVFVVNPPGHDGPTATCVGPGAPATMPNPAPWNAHFNSGGVVTHPGDCPEEL